MPSHHLSGYLNILAIGVYGIEILTLGTGFITILRGHHVSDEMDWLYLLNIVKIFIITGYVFLHCCWQPSPEQKTCNRIVYCAMALISLLAIAGSVVCTIYEISRNFNDENEDNDYLIYIVSVACLLQSLLLGSYSVFFIRYMHDVEVNGGDDEKLIANKGNDKEITSILNRMSK